MIDETITYLEMTSRDELVPGRVAPSRLNLEEVVPDAVSVARSTYVRIGAPLTWAVRSGRMRNGKTSWRARESGRGWDS